MGPVIENILNYLPSLPNGSVDLWSVGEFPFNQIPSEFIESVKKSKNLLVIEEHNKPGGLSEALSTEILKLKINDLEFKFLTANSYPSGLYGSQTWHQLENNLAGQGLANVITGMLNERN
jgi:transketolase